MRLLIIRHGLAVEREEWRGPDHNRPLTDVGVRKTRRVMKALREVLSMDEIWTSPWLRARSTAEIIANVWAVPMREQPWLASHATSPAQIIKHLSPATQLIGGVPGVRWANGLALVGHEPDLSELVEYLSGGKIEMKKAAVAVLEGDPKRCGMTIETLLSPHMTLGLRAP